jgi:hypothetical protein
MRISLTNFETGDDAPVKSSEVRVEGAPSWIIDNSPRRGYLTWLAEINVVFLDANNLSEKCGNGVVESLNNALTRLTEKLSARS